MSTFQQSNGWFTFFTLNMKVSVEPDGYKGGRQETNFELTVTCLPCRRVKPTRKKTRVTSSAIVLSSGSSEPFYYLPDLAKEMFELFENDIPCPLESELGLRRADKRWEPLEVIPGIKVNYSDFG